MTAPSPLREQLCSVRLPEVVTCVRRFRCAAPTTPLAAARFALRGLAERWTALDAELRCLDEQLTRLVQLVAAPLLAVHGVGVDTAALSLWRPEITQNGCLRRPPWRRSAVPAQSIPPLAASTDIV